MGAVEQRVEGEDGGCVEVVEVRGAEGPEWIRVEGLFSVWLRPDGRRMASVAPGLWSVGRNACLFFAFSQ